MKPDAPTSRINMDQMPGRYGNGIEFVPNTVEKQEIITGQSIERGVSADELKASATDIGLVTSLPAPVADDTVVTSTSSTTSPLVAKDDDLIEKEWIDKAKKIVSETRDDPHQQENEVVKLQVDYLKKRFGRELKPSK